MAEGQTGVQKKAFHAAHVVKHGSTLIVPATMPYADAAAVLIQKAEEEESLVEFKERIPGFVLDGAYAFQRATEEVLGFVIAKATPTMFGPKPPQYISVQINPEGDKVNVLWGRMAFPFAELEEKKKKQPSPDDEVLFCGIGEHDGRYVFEAKGQVRYKYLDVVKKIANRARELVKTSSIYKSQAVRVEFTDASGDTIPMLTPEFLQLGKIDINDVIFSKETEAIIKNYVITPITNAEQCRQAGIPLKRGILAAGEYGTGKTLLAFAVAKIGVEHGWTFIYIRNAKELPMALRFAKLYEPCIVFAEDLDRATAGEKRTEQIDQILNTLDGIDSKSSELMVILTTNHLDQVNQAMRRPGRLDVAINVLPPDGEACVRLLRVYGRKLIAENANLEGVAEILSGKTPAVIREVVERAKMVTISRTGKHDSMIEVDDLAISARQMLGQIEMMKFIPPPPPSLEDKLREVFRESSESAIKDTLVKHALNEESKKQ